MASKSNRARRLERARAERRMAKLAAEQRKRRRVQAGIGGAVALIVLVLGTTWLLGGFDSKPEAPVTLPDCTWTSRQVTEGVAETGLPPSTVPLTGVRTLLIDTNLGEIEAVVDVGSAFCGAASVDFLAGLGLYDGTTCDEIDTTTFVLTCGGDTTPNYQFYTEGLPRTPLGTTGPDGTETVYYLKGAVLLRNIDVGAVGSQLMIVYADGSPLPGDYTQIGLITSGMGIIEQIAAGGAVDASGAAVPVGTPAQELTFTTAAMTDQVAESPSPTASPTASATPSASSTS